MVGFHAAVDCRFVGAREKNVLQLGVPLLTLKSEPIVVLPAAMKRSARSILGGFHESDASRDVQHGQRVPRWVEDHLEGRKTTHQAPNNDGTVRKRGCLPTSQPLPRKNLKHVLDTTTAVGFFRGRNLR